jgi:hypothetical protein
MAFKQAVPKRVKPFNVLALRHSLAVWSIGGLPVWKRIHVEVLAIAAQAEFDDSVRDKVSDKPARLRVAEVQEDGVAADVEHPVAVLLVPLGALHDALRFEPEH